MSFLIQLVTCSQVSFPLVYYIQKPSEIKELQMGLLDSDFGQSTSDIFLLVKMAKYWPVLASCTFLD